MIKLVDLMTAYTDPLRIGAAFDLAFSKAFLTAEGSVDARKHQAVVETHRLRVEADVADTVVRHLRRKIDEIKTRIATGQSVGAAVRAEMRLAGLDGEA